MFAALLLTTLLSASVSDGQTDQVPTHAQAEELALAGDHRAALEAFRQRAAANPNDLDARVWIAHLHEQMGNSDLAEPVYRSVVWESPTHVDAALRLAALLTKKRRHDEVVRVLERAREAEPTNPEVLEGLGRAHLRLSNTKLGHALLELAAAMAPEDVSSKDKGQSAEVSQK
jgi:Flp pilus assembly protein TadD